MKIALIHYKLKHLGGMESYLLNLIDGFNEQNDEVHIYTSAIGANISVHKKCIIKKLTTFILLKKYRLVRFYQTCQNYIKDNDYDIIISLSHTYCQDILICGGTHLGFLRHKKNTFWRWLHHKITLFYERKAIQSSKYIIAHSKMMVNELKNYYHVDQKKIFLLYPSINNRFCQALRVNKTMYQKKFNISPNKITLLFVSMNHKRKGLNKLMLALAELPLTQFELIICGRKPKIKLPLNIKYIGYCLEIEKLYVAVDFTILLSSYEPFGMILAESLACGTPIIATKQVGASEIISTTEGIILEDNDKDSIKECLMTLEKKHFNIDKNFLIRNGLTVSQHIHSIKSIYQKTLKSPNEDA